MKWIICTSKHQPYTLTLLAQFQKTVPHTKLLAKEKQLLNFYMDMEMKCFSISVRVFLILVKVKKWMKNSSNLLFTCKPQGVLLIYDENYEIHTQLYPKMDDTKMYLNFKNGFNENG